MTYATFSGLPTNNARLLQDMGMSCPLKISSPHSDATEVVEMDLNMVKEELEDTVPEQRHSESIITNLHHWKGKKIKSVQSLKRFIADCSLISLQRKRKHLCGPVWLAVCPKCFAVYKNCHDRLIRLYNHITKRHGKNKDLYLKEIIKSCDKLIHFMVRTWKVKHA